VTNEEDQDGRLAIAGLIATAGVVTAGESDPLDCKCEPAEGSSGEIAPF
jgi:hypothetical protein